MTRDKNERNRPSGGRLEDISGALLVRRFSERQPELYRVIEKVVSQKLTTTSVEALCELSQTVMDIDYSDIPGQMMQIGRVMAGDAIVLAKSKRRSRVLGLYTVSDLSAELSKNLTLFGIDERDNVHCVEGQYTETLSAQDDLAMVLVDVREYESLTLILENVVPRLSPKSQLILSAYKRSEACQKAVEDYFHGKSGFARQRKNRLHLIRV